MGHHRAELAGHDHRKIVVFEFKYDGADVIQAIDQVLHAIDFSDIQCFFGAGVDIFQRGCEIFVKVRQPGVVIGIAQVIVKAQRIAGADRAFLELVM